MLVLASGCLKNNFGILYFFEKMILKVSSIAARLVIVTCLAMAAASGVALLV